MKRRIISIGVISLFVVILLYLSYLHFKPAFLSRIVPTQTSIFAGPVDSQLVIQLRATQSNGEISKEQAIGLAEFYCASVHSPSQKNPSNIEAYHLTEEQAMRRLSRDQTSTSLTPVWLVSMDGSWEHDGPVQSTQIPPLIFTHCNVIINARTADMMVVTN